MESDLDSDLDSVVSPLSQGDRPASSQAPDQLVDAMREVNSPGDFDGSAASGQAFDDPDWGLPAQDEFDPEPDDRFDEPLSGDPVRTSVPLFECKVTEDDDYESDWCFACELTSRKGNKLMIELNRRVNAYGTIPDPLWIHYVQHYFDTHIRPDLPGQPRWTRRVILAHAQSHSVNTTFIQRNSIRHLNEVQLLIGRTSIRERDAQGQEYVNFKGVNSLVTVSRQIAAILKELKT